MRYGLSILAVMLFLIFGVVLLTSGTDSSTDPSKIARLTKLADYENKDTASISWTIQGKVTGDDQYRSIRVTVTKSKRTLEILDGYAGRVEKSAEFDNSSQAFATFTRALDNLSFGRERRVILADERGVCPLGSRAIYRLTDGGKEIMRTWSDSCTPKDGPFGGTSTATATIRDLFQLQITDYNKLVSGIKL